MSRNPATFRRSCWRRAAVLLACLPLVAASRPALSQACWVRGDVNGDERIDISDPVRIINGLYVDKQCVGPAADVNDNGYVTIADPFHLLFWLYGGRLYPPPAPYPTCGQDPTSGTYGFGQPNPDYGILASAPLQIGNRVYYQLKYRSVASLVALSIGFEIAPTASLLEARFELASGVTSSTAQKMVSYYQPTPFRELAVAFTAFEYHFNRDGEMEAELLPATNFQWEDLGVLTFEFTRITDPSVISWKPTVELGGCELRATMVNGLDAQDAVSDHSPTFVQETEPQGFRRESVSFADVLAYLFEGGAPPTDCRGQVDLDAADSNDNESITVADALKLRAHSAGRTSLPAPSLLCGTDPTDDRGGFDRVDPSYRLTAGNVSIIRGGSGRVDEVHVPIQVDIPAPITGAQMVLKYDASALIPFDAGEGGAFSAATGRTLVRKIENGDEGLLIIGVHVEDDGRILRPADPGRPAHLGTLHFHLRGSGGFRPIKWVDEIAVEGRSYRASLVDEDFADHHPRLLAGEHLFVRGNSNSDEGVDVSDIKFTTDFLYLGGRTPDCLDAADANNDGVVDVSDAIFTSMFLFLGGEMIPEPFPQCGLDTVTIDLLDCGPPAGRNVCR
jgi:hypothetical protein